MAKRVSVDRWIFFTAIVLVFLGLVMVFSASAVMAKERFGSAYYFLLRQSAFALVGLLALVGLMQFDYRRLKHPAVVFGVLGVTTVLLVAVLFLDRAHNVHRWIRIGSFSFQPSEFAKPALILFLSYFLETRTKAMTEWKETILPASVPVLLYFCLISLQPDLGTALMCIFVSVALLFVAGLQVRYIGYAVAAMLPVLYFLVWRVPWRKERVLAWLDPFSDPQGRGFHTVQSLIAVGTGGVTGAGLMESKQKLFYLPEAHTDFIYAVTAEEFGLIGSIVVVALFCIFCVRGLRVAARSKDTFGRFLATGITAMIGIQALFNISVVLALLPTKGIPLPFISYGGTSLVVAMASVGVLLNISRQVD